MVSWLRKLWKNNTFKIVLLSFFLGFAVIAVLRVMYMDEEE